MHRAEIPIRFEAPFKVPNGPVLHRTYVQPNISIDLGTERWQPLAVCEIVLHELGVVRTNEVTGSLQVTALGFHQDGDDIVPRVSFCLFHVV